MTLSSVSPESFHDLSLGRYTVRTDMQARRKGLTRLDRYDRSWGPHGTIFVCPGRYAGKRILRCNLSQRRQDPSRRLLEGDTPGRIACRARGEGRALGQIPLFGYRIRTESRIVSACSSATSSGSADAWDYVAGPIPSSTGQSLYHCNSVRTLIPGT